MQQQLLVIDDSPEIHALVRALLTNEQIEIHSAASGEFGLVLAASLKPDLILLDVDMPGMTGFEACKKLKSDPLTAGVPVVFLTALSTVDEKVKGLNLGAVDYITKPFDRAELWARVRASLRTSYYVRLLVEKALIDPLTGLGNLAMFKERFAEEVARRIRSGNPLSCIVLDVDRFKNVNDKYGHPFGDLVLKTIADTVNDICRVEDIACRHGGEEFVIITPQTPADNAMLLAERMRVAIAGMVFSHDGESVSVTCSFGIAEAAGTYDRLMLERADQALYESKKRGRNCISVAPSNPTAQTVAA